MASPWLCDSLRLSALWHDPTRVDAKLPWDAVGGTTPETQDSQPRQGTAREAGPIGDGSVTLELRTGPGRIDWLLLPTINATMLTDLPRSFPNLGSVDDAIRFFDDLIFDKAAGAYEAPRLALGMTAIHPAADRNASYTELRNILSTISPDLDGTSDFLYQINRPRESTIARGVIINRLMRWSSVVLTGLTVTPIVSAQVVGLVPHIQPVPLNATRIELDLSTPGDRASELPSATRLPLLREMAALAVEIIRDGDRP